MVLFDLSLLPLPHQNKRRPEVGVRGGNCLPSLKVYVTAWPFVMPPTPRCDWLSSRSRLLYSLPQRDRTMPSTAPKKNADNSSTDLPDSRSIAGHCQRQAHPRCSTPGGDIRRQSVDLGEEEQPAVWDWRSSIRVSLV